METSKTPSPASDADASFGDLSPRYGGEVLAGWSARIALRCRSSPTPLPHTWGRGHGAGYGTAGAGGWLPSCGCGGVLFPLPIQTPIQREIDHKSTVHTQTITKIASAVLR